MIKALKHVRGEKVMLPHFDYDDIQNNHCAQVYVKE